MSSLSISEHYRKLSPEDAEVMGRVYADSWQDPSLPRRQYEACVRNELEAYRNGEPCRPYDALAALLERIPQLNNAATPLLDIGASSGYYSEVLRLLNFQCSYTALDYSPYYRDFAEQLFQGIVFKVGSATEIPFEDKSFDIVLSGACLMHLWNYVAAIKEAIRVSREYVIFHRTPVYLDETPTEFFVKTAYGVPTFEVHFNEAEFLGLLANNGLTLKAMAEVEMQGSFGHRSYLCQR